jgi:electron transport complex protein RnfG
MITVLAVVGVFAGGTLAFIYRWAKPQIEAHERELLRQAIFNVLPETKSYEFSEKDGVGIYHCEDSSRSLVGYAFVAEGGGYQDKIKMMVGLKTDLKTLGGIEILYSRETPGLGGKIDSEDILQPVGKTFTEQFRELEVLPPIEYVKGKKPISPNQIQAITGATISSRSVVGIINETVAKVRKILK